MSDSEDEDPDKKKEEEKSNQAIISQARNSAKKAREDVIHDEFALAEAQRRDVLNPILEHKKGELGQEALNRGRPRGKDVNEDPSKTRPNKKPFDETTRLRNLDLFNPEEISKLLDLSGKQIHQIGALQSQTENLVANVNTLNQEIEREISGLNMDLNGKNDKVVNNIGRMQLSDMAKDYYTLKNVYPESLQ